MSSNLSLIDIEGLAKKMGSRRSQAYLTGLGKQHSLILALETEVGKEILDSAVNRLDSLLKKIIEEKAEPEELAEYRVLRDITNRWAKMIDAYYNNLNKIDGGKHV